MPHKIINTKIFLLLAVLTTLSGCAGGLDKIKQDKPVYPPPPNDPKFIYERTIRSTADIRETTFADKLKVFATGTAQDAFGFEKPYGIEARKGKIYVADTVQRSVILLDTQNMSFKHIGSEEPGALRKPIDLDIGPNDELYVVDNTTAKVLIYTPDGNYIREIDGSAYLSRPSGVAVSNDGKKVYVVDTAGIQRTDHAVHVFDNVTGEHLQVIGTRGTQHGEFNLPLLADVAPDGTLYVVDGTNFRVQGFNPDGSFKLQIGAIGIKSGQLSKPRGIATDHDGNIYVIDTNFGNFQIFNDQGQLLLFIGERGATDGPGQYLLPADVAIDEDGRIYVTDQFYKKVDIYRPASLKEDEGYLGVLAK